MLFGATKDHWTSIRNLPRIKKGSSHTMINMYILVMCAFQKQTFRMTLKQVILLKNYMQRSKRYLESEMNDPPVDCDESFSKKEEEILMVKWKLCR